MHTRAPLTSGLAYKNTSSLRYSILPYQIEPESDPDSSNDEEGQAEPLQARLLKDVYEWAGISQSIPVACKLFPSVMRAVVMRVDVRRAMHSDTIHEAYKRFSILHLNTF
ncbi:hypothetical protein DPX16_14650 [Anabarilius grahami]|uniref:Uncharacterized protein n=1 Tax=Anabarilius grahami TaxID=495550 RepID=A0A3N0XPN6_ANAGA|nr:hypothetical protein DPX16_14650 [Anabarilius grahami]